MANEENQTQAAPQTPQTPPLGICERCKNPIYRKEDLVIHHYNLRSSRQYYHCAQCEAKMKEENARQAAATAAKRRMWSYILGGLGAAVVLAIMIATGIFKTPSLIAVGVVTPILTFTLISCLLLSNNFVGDLIVGIASRSIRMPGVIFGLSLDGIVWFLTVKLGLLVLSILISIALLLLAVAVGLVVSVFVYPFALVKSIKHPDDDN